MAGASRVAWREGLFLRPQHFQQQDRYFDALQRARASALQPYAWGLTEIVVDEGLAPHAKFGVERCAGILPDGLPFALPQEAPPPPPIDVPPDTRNAIVYLTLPPEQIGAPEFRSRAQADAATRYLVDEADAYDAFAQDRQSERIEVATPNLRFGITREQTEGRVKLGLARIRDVDNGRVHLDSSYIPPTLDVRVSARMVSWLADILGRSGQRVDELSRRAAEATDGGAETFASFLMLQLLNKWSPALAHMKTLPDVHPERLYESLLSMAGELCTLTREERRPPAFPDYEHENLQACFEPVIDSLQTSLSAMFDRAAGQLRLQKVGPGAYTATITDHSIFETSNLYLAVSAVNSEEVRARFSQIVKIGTVPDMRDIVANALQAGVKVIPTPTPPPQLRILPGYVYFELDRSSDYWRKFATAPGIGLHVSGDWANLKLELWWVKRARR